MSGRGEKRKHGTGGNWSYGLKAATKDPALRVDSDEETVTIKDKYPKAKHHFLILPKDEGVTGLDCLTDSHVPLLEHMHRRAEGLVKSICEGESEMDFRIGYHAVPSMRFLHVHVISQDFNSPCLKTKKHWNSFTSDFFLDSGEVIRKLKTKGKVEVDAATYESLLKGPLRCHVCRRGQRDMPELKRHIASCYPKRDRSQSDQNPKTRLETNA